MVRVPETKYAKSGGTHIAYSVSGSGPFDIVLVPGMISHLELQWEDEPFRRFMERLGSLARVIRFDKRNMGLSDRIGDTASPLEDRMDDVRAVMDAAGSEQAAVMGVSEGGALAVMFAASYPERVTALVLAGASARMLRADDYPHGAPPEAQAKLLGLVERGWGTGVMLPLMFPDGAEPAMQERWARFERMAASPGAAVATIRMAADVDVRPLLP
ncbi:MAG: alpha/beta fold hydrolase, partial [Acidimicrobiia bacterium]